jgi:hypothetical protein
VDFVDHLVQRDRAAGLVTHLHQFTGFFLLGHQPFTFLRIVAAGLFEVDVLTGFEGHDGHRGVPVVGGGDDDGVHVPVVEEAAEILVAARAHFGYFVDAFLGFLYRSDVHIADAEHEAVFGTGEYLGQLVAPAVSAKDGNIHPAVSSQDVAADHRRGNGETSGGDGSGFEEFSSVWHDGGFANIGLGATSVDPKAQRSQYADGDFFRERTLSCAWQ